MTLLRDLRRLGASVLAPVALCAALLSACGGGTSQVVAFQPARLIVFGDETSVIEDLAGNHDGYKYGINDRATATTVGQCQLLPTFAQILASHYGFVFDQCNVTGLAVKAISRAQVGATVDSATTGLAFQRGLQSDLGPQDLVSVMIGSNDIIALYQQVQTGVPFAMTHADAIAEAQRLGAVAAAQINAILATGARAIVITVPNMGLSPYAVTANTAHPGASVLLAELSYEYNAYLRTSVDSSKYDGRNYGLVLADDIVAAMNKTPNAFLTSPYDVANAACTSATLTACVIATDSTQTTLVAGASATTHLWADDRHLGPNAHNQIGSQALSRAINNPF